MTHFPRLHQLWLAPHLLHEHERRGHRVRLVVSTTMLVMGVFWGVFFTYKQMWSLVGMDLLLCVTSIQVFRLTLQHRTRAANLLMFGALYVIVTAISLVQDPPTALAPRTTHLYLLPVAMAALVAFQDEPRSLRYAVVGLYCGTFIALSASTASLLPELALPDSIRTGGGWIQALVATVAIFILLHVLRTDATERSELEAELVQALMLKQFELHYQPQMNADGQVVGAEALLRWRHPTKGLVMPGHFIALAEESGLIIPIGQWVLETACAQLQTWSGDPVRQHWVLAVNISQKQIRLNDFTAQTRALLEHHQIAPGVLELELTETMLVDNFEDTREKMEALVSMGVKFSLDDFGTGYSSLKYLQHLPLTKLKIDQSFVFDLPDGATSAAIVRTVLALGTSMALKVVAEGVETEAQLRFLLDNDCQLFQGYLFSRPMPLADFERWAEQQTVTVSATSRA